jgi:hypothetical protein
VFLAQAPGNLGLSYPEIDFKHALWVNASNPNSLRLTINGYNWAIRICNQTAYKVVTNNFISNGTLLKLERLMTAPYYINEKNKLNLFSEQDSIMLSLHSGNLNRYLKDLEGGQQD